MKPALLAARDCCSPMSKTILLDSGPLGLVSNPNVSPANEACRDWVRKMLAQGCWVAISEIADYEIRRELLRAGKTGGVARPDILKSSLAYIPLTTPVMLKAAEFWARARQL